MEAGFRSDFYSGDYCLREIYLKGSLVARSLELLARSHPRFSQLFTRLGYSSVSYGLIVGVLCSTLELFELENNNII